MFLALFTTICYTLIQIKFKLSKNEHVKYAKKHFFLKKQNKKD